MFSIQVISLFTLYHAYVVFFFSLFILKNNYLAQIFVISCQRQVLMLYFWGHSCVLIVHSPNGVLCEHLKISLPREALNSFSVKWRENTTCTAPRDTGRASPSSHAACPPITPPRSAGSTTMAFFQAYGRSWFLPSPGSSHTLFSLPKILFPPHISLAKSYLSFGYLLTK